MGGMVAISQDSAEIMGWVGSHYIYIVCVCVCDFARESFFVSYFLKRV